MRPTGFKLAAPQIIAAKHRSDQQRRSGSTYRHLFENASSADWRNLRKAFDGIVDNNVSLKTNLRSDTEGQWLTPFKPFPRPRTASLRALAHTVHSLPYVQQLCRPILAPSAGASMTSATHSARNG